MRPVSKIFSDITKSVSSSGIQFLITLVTTPLMTRLYDPSAYAAFGVINTLAATVIGMGLLSLPVAYPSEKDPAIRIQLIHIMLVLVGALALLSGIAAIGLVATDALHLEAFAVMLLPVLVLTGGIRQIMLAVATARAHFGSVALGQILEPTCSRGGSIALGAAFGSHPLFILLAVAAGHLVSATIVFKRALGGVATGWRTLLRPNRQSLRALLHHRDFALYNTTSQQAQPLALLGIQMLVIALFTPHMGGQYILAVSILTLPVSLISLASARVVYRHFIEVEHTTPQALPRHVLAATAFYLAIGTVILAPVFFFGEPLFAVAFGRTWAQAGTIASALSIGYIGSFAVVGLQSVFYVTKRIRLLFWLEAILCAAAFGVAMLYFKTVDFDTAMFYLCGLWVVRSFVLLAACILVAIRHANLHRRAL